MNYKIKSLLYFVCLVLSAFTYYGLESNQNQEQNYSTVEIVEVTNENFKPAYIIELADLN
ncbi:MAG: hypothetical protein WBN20_00095 [Eudoraea sp.]|uniref:hypothetical protein n=1 Tax=Eudoraea sp. TaxID=1979955 RepID=UPI003C73D62B